MNLLARLWKNADWELRFPLFIGAHESLRHIVAPSKLRICLRALQLLLQKVVRHNGPQHVVLTFDDGPYDASTEPLLAALQRENVPATFFMVGNDAAANGASVKAIAAAGMEIASHSKSHPRLTTLTPQEQLDEIAGGRKLVEQAAGCNVVLFRPPHGAFDRTTLEMVRQTGQTVALWNVNPADYTDISADAIVEAVVAQRRNPAVILLHCDRPQTIAAIPEIVRRYRDMGFSFTTLGRLQARHVA